MDTSFPTLYKEIEKRYMGDKEFTPEIIYVLTENTYREELLKFFGVEYFDQEVINASILSLYDKIKENTIVQTAVEKLQEKYQDEVTSFMILFSYDYFHLFYPCVQAILAGKEPESFSV
jgi:hypothetical protein